MKTVLINGESFKVSNFKVEWDGVNHKLTIGNEELEVEGVKKCRVKTGDSNLMELECYG